MSKKLGRQLLLMSLIVRRHIQTELEADGGEARKNYAPLQKFELNQSLVHSETVLSGMIQEIILEESESVVSKETLKELAPILDQEELDYATFGYFLQNLLSHNYFVGMELLGLAILGEEEYTKFKLAEEMANKTMEETEKQVASWLNTVNSNWIHRCATVAKNSK